MRNLNRIIFINSANIPYADDIYLDGNIHFIGTQGVGKSTILRAILFFYNADTQKLGIPVEKQSYTEYYFPYSNSYIVYEVATENGPFCILSFKSMNRVCYRFIDSPYRKEFFIDEESRTAYSGTDRIRAILDQYDVDYSRIIYTYDEYRNILYGNEAGADMQRYALMESKQYQNIPRTIQNVLLNSKLDAEFIKKTIISSLNEEDTSVDLNTYKEHLKNFETRLRDIEEFQKRETQKQAAEITRLATEVNRRQTALVQGCRELAAARIKAEEALPQWEEKKKQAENDLDRPYFGHIFSDEDKRNLLETGNMGRVVELKGRNGEYIPSFISIDKLTNEVVAMKAENAFIPREIKGVELTEQEQNDLREGKKVYVEGMIAKSGNEFNAFIQVNAERRGVEFIFENDKLFNRQTLGGVELTQKQIEDLNAGKAIFVEGMQRKDGEVFSSYVKLDEATGRPSYTRYNPDSPEGAREIYIPNEINGVKITAEEQQQLRDGKVIFLNDMVNRKGEEFSSFIKADLETGRLSYSRTPDGFEQREDFKIPTKVWDVELTRQQRADLQSGKAVLVEGIKGYDGKTISQYVKANFNQGRLDFYNENPDRKRDASQRNVVPNSQRQEQGNRKSKGASIA